MLEKGYTSTNKYREALTYLNEAFSSGAEIIRLARMVQSVDIEGATPEEITVFFRGSYPTVLQGLRAVFGSEGTGRDDEDRERTCISGVLAGYLYER